MEVSSPTIPFGDVVQRVTASIFTDLQQLLSLLHTISPETRTIKLVNFLADAKKKIFHLLVVKKWLGSNNTTGYFKSLQQLDFMIQNMNLQLNIMQDNLYRLHGELYGKRIRQINVNLGFDVLSSGTYPTFPLSVLTCGQLPLPNDPVLTLSGDQSSNTSSDIQQMKKDLGLFLQAKLLLHDSVPSTITCVEMKDGFLVMKQPYLYEVSLSLQDLRPDAAWLVLGCRILCSNHVLEFQHSASVREYDVAACEEEVYRCLDTLSGDDEAWRKMMSLETRLATVPATHASQTAHVTLNSLSDQESASRALTLTQIDRICTHAAEGVLLRILYTQFQDLKRSPLWVGKMEVDFQDVGPLAYLALRFGASPSVQGRYRYELQVLSLHQPVAVQTAPVSPTNSSSSASTLSITHSAPASQKTKLCARLMVLDDLSNLNLPTLNPATLDTEALTQLELDKWLTQYQDRSSARSATHRVRPSVLASEIDLDMSTVTEGVSSRQLLGDSLRTLARARVKTLAARIFMSQHWPEWSRAGLQVRMDLNLCSVTVRLSSVPSASLVLCVDTRESQWCYYGDSLTVFKSFHCAGLAELFLNEANNILSEQLMAGSLVSDQVQAEVDRALAISQSGVSTATSSSQPYVYLRPMATMEALFDGLIFIQSMQSSISTLGLHSVVTISRGQWVELLRACQGSRVVPEDLNLTPALVCELERWTMPRRHCVEDALRAYQSVLPSSTPYFDSSAVSVDSRDSSISVAKPVTSVSSTFQPSTVGADASSAELKPFLKRFLKTDGHDDNILVKKKVRRTTSVATSSSSLPTSAITTGSDTSSTTSALVNSLRVEQDVRLFLMVHVKPGAAAELAIHAILVSQPKTTGDISGNGFIILKTECLAASVPLVEGNIRSQMPSFIVAAARWKNHQSVPAFIDPSYLFPQSSTAAYTHLISPGACVVLQPHGVKMGSMELVAYADSSRGLKSRVSGSGLVVGSPELLQYVNFSSTCAELFKLLISFSTSSANSIIVEEETNSRTLVVSVSSSVSESESALPSTNRTENILSLLFHRLLSSELLHSSLQVQQIFSRPSFRRLCALSVFLAFLESHSYRVSECATEADARRIFDDADAESGSVLARLKLVHVNAQSVDQPVAILAVESLQLSDADKKPDSVSAPLQWNLHGFIQVTAIDAAPAGSETITLLFQDTGRKGFEDKVDSAALVSEKVYISLLLRLFALHKMFLDNQ